jgi:hypothetical protein
MKTCIKCLATKSVLLFPKRGNDCKECVAVYMAIYRTENNSRIAQLKKEWKLSNSDHVKAKDKAYSLLYPERRAQAGVKWRLANPEVNKEHKAKYVIHNKEAVKLSKTAWAISNPDKLRARDARRRAAKLERTPKWETFDDKETISHIYWLAVEFSRAFDTKYEVDHIIPLQGTNVSGLHTPANLQIIPAANNRVKSNSYEL